MRFGASFSPRQAAYLGLDRRQTFRQLLELRLAPIRLSVFWDEVDGGGYGDLDWQLDEAERAGLGVLLGVGMKGQRWPEFYIPSRLAPPARAWADVAASSPSLRAGVLELVARTVERYRGHPALVAWQVENEPLNRSGPKRWWIGPDFVAQEIAEVRRLDPTRPLLLNGFAHFNLILDILSNPIGLGIGRLVSLIGPGDVLGLDVYVRIGFRLLGLEGVASATSGWADQAARWRARAEAEGRQAWITEAQAEPWEATPATNLRPRSFSPSDLTLIADRLRLGGFHTILLWGSEYWLARAAAGDPRWVEAVRSLVA